MSAVPSSKCCLLQCNSFGQYHASVDEETKSESQKIDNLPTLATCWSGILAILSSDVDGPVHESTWLIGALTIQEQTHVMLQVSEICNGYSLEYKKPQNHQESSN